MSDFVSENYADSNSDCENDMTLNCSIDKSSNEVTNDEILQRIFQWKEPAEKDLIKILDFPRKHGLKIDI